MLELITNAAMLFGLGAAADTLVKSRTKKSYADLVFSYRRRFVAEVAQFVVSLFLVLFAGRRQGISFLRSALLSVVLFVVFSYLTTQLMGENLIDLIRSGSHENKSALVTVLVMNCIADYLSLLQTKYLMMRLVDRSVLVQLVGLIVDIAVTFLVISGFIGVAFWLLASSLGIPGWEWSNPSIIIWQMCHQLDSTLITLSNSAYEITNVCNLLQVSGTTSASQSKSFEHAFNTASTLTSYMVSAWVIFFIFAQLFMRFLQMGFTAYSKRVTKIVNYQLLPFSITSLFFAALYLSVSAPALMLAP